LVGMSAAPAWADPAPPAPAQAPPSPAPAPQAQSNVWELSYGRTLPVVPIPGMPVPLGGEVGITSGPGWTDFALTGMAGHHAGPKSSIEERPERSPGFSGEAKVTGILGPAKGEVTVNTDLEKVTGSVKGSLGPVSAGRNFQLYPNPEMEGWRAGTST